MDTRNFLMTLDLQAAWQQDRWTVYGTVGRQPRGRGGRLVSYEHWIAYQVTERGKRARRSLPARLRCPLRRSHVLHPRRAATGAGRPDLRCRSGRVDRSRAVAGIRRSGTRRVTHRRRGARRVHLDGAVPVRPESSCRRRGLRPLSRRVDSRPGQHRRRALLRVRPGRVADYLDARRRPAPGIRHGHPFLYRRQPDLGRGVPRRLAPGVAAGALGGWRPAGGNPPHGLRPRLLSADPLARQRVALSGPAAPTTVCACRRSLPSYTCTCSVGE